MSFDSVKADMESHQQDQKPWPQDKDGLEVLPDKIGVIFHLNKRQFRVNKATTTELAADYAAVEEHLMRDRKGPIEAILPEVERLAAFPKLQTELLDRAYADLRQGQTQQKLTIREIAAWMDTLAGILFMMGRALRRLHPEVTDGDIMEIMTRVGSTEMEKARDAINQEAIARVLPQVTT